MNIENKTVLITGANRGIGKALECRCVLRVRRAERVLGTRSHDSRSWYHEMEGGVGRTSDPTATNTCHMWNASPVLVS